MRLSSLTARHDEPRPIYRHRGTRVWLLGKLVARVLFSSFLVFGTYNPTGRSYLAWLSHSDAAPLWKLVATGLLLVAYGVAVPAVWRGLGLGGVILAITLATTTSWALVQAGWIDLGAPDTPGWILLSVTAFVIGTGLAWSLIGRILDGRLRTRDITR